MAYCQRYQNFDPGLLANFWPTPRPATVTLMEQGTFVDWKAKVDLFEQLRREHEFGIGTIARALPPAQHYPERARP
jgi:hypothetical protein